MWVPNFRLDFIAKTLWNWFPYNQTIFALYEWMKNYNENLKFDKTFFKIDFLTRLIELIVKN